MYRLAAFDPSQVCLWHQIRVSSDSNEHWALVDAGPRFLILHIMCGVSSLS